MNDDIREDDPVRPSHYVGKGDMQPIDMIEAFDLGFCLGNAVKYIARAGRKTPDAMEDLRKAQWYLDREIARLESEERAR